MKVEINYNEQAYHADLSRPIDISLELNHHTPVNCYFAPPFRAEPVSTKSFTGSIADGFPVNFFNIFINPHGNGTHTECVGHIKAGDFYINEQLKKFHMVMRLISVEPQSKDGDLIIGFDQIKKMETIPEAVMIRTLPNLSQKRSMNYSGTNPPYFDPELMAYLSNSGVKHFLTDLPSVDREEDGGKLRAHRAFFGDSENYSTITELAYAPDSVPDGLYLLNLHILNIRLDVSPSRPVLYNLEINE